MRARVLIFAACLLVSCPVLAQEKIIDIPDDEPVEVQNPKTGEAVTVVPPDDAGKQAAEYNMIVLQGLNKVTGHISKIEGPMGTVMNFGSLEIIARRCWKAAPEDQPENAALLEIRENKPGEGPQQIFLGWMFSSSPALSGLEHPVYDISVVACESRADPEKTEKPPEKTEKKKDAPTAKVKK